MWQELRAELHPAVEIVTVALDVDPDAARPFVEAAYAEHPSLVDTTHVLDAAFGIVNVPSSVWIDEQGLLVRPAESAYVRAWPKAAIPDGASPERRAVMEQVAQLHNDHEAYTAAVRDWARNGAASRFALSPDAVVARSAPRPRAAAEAAAHFELGAHLRADGHLDAARAHWREAHRLQPENWTYKRQAWQLEDPGRQHDTRAHYDSNFATDFLAAGAAAFYSPFVP